MKQPRKLAQTVVDRLAGRIRRGEFKAGDKLPTEYEITRAFGVSRTVVREAMSRLQAAELVETRHGVGTFVREGADSAPFRIAPVETATLNELIAILELRLSIEAEAAALAASRRSQAHLAAMRRHSTVLPGTAPTFTGSACGGVFPGNTMEPSRCTCTKPHIASN